MAITYREVMFLLNCCLLILVGLFHPFAATQQTLSKNVSPLWNGLWRENVAKSKIFFPETVTISAHKNGRLRYSSDSGTDYIFVCAGKGLPEPTIRTLACKRAGPRLYLTTVQLRGGMTVEGSWELSADGCTLTAKTWRHAPDGSQPVDMDVFTRIGKSSGLEGVWRKKTSEETPDVYRITVHGKELTDALADGEFTIHAKLDGSPAQVERAGKILDSGNRYTVRSPLQIIEAKYSNGTFVAESLITVSPDGRTMTEVHWDVGHEDKKVTKFFEKQ